MPGRENGSNESRAAMKPVMADDRCHPDEFQAVLMAVRWRLWDRSEQKTPAGTGGRADRMI